MSPRIEIGKFLLFALIIHRRYINSIAPRNSFASPRCLLLVTERPMPRFATFALILLAMLTSSSLAQKTAPDDWTFVTVRDETAAGSSVTADERGTSLIITGNGDALADGRWVK